MVSMVRGVKAESDCLPECPVCHLVFDSSHFDRLQVTLCPWWDFHMEQDSPKYFLIPFPDYDFVVGMEILTTPPPEPRIVVQRLTESIRSLQPGQSVILDTKTARCAVEHFRYRGFKVTQRTQEDGRVQIWVL